MSIPVITMVVHIGTGVSLINERTVITLFPINPSKIQPTDQTKLMPAYRTHYSSAGCVNKVTTKCKEQSVRMQVLDMVEERQTILCRNNYVSIEVYKHLKSYLRIGK